MGEVQQTACLALGGIAKHVVSTKPKQAVRIVHLMETWLQREKGSVERHHVAHIVVYNIYIFSKI
jgi:hypothetical protein